jgi:radical SAM superfamily enzyme YgiQ (UPF0313 family)
MLDLLIINPPSSTAYGDLDPNLVACEPPLWCRLIAGYIRDRGFNVKIVDAEAEGLRPADLAAHLEPRPRLICIAVYGHQPSASTQQMAGAGAVAKAFKDIPFYDQIPIIMVGGHVSALPQRTMKEESIDFACVGEGPVTIANLLGGTETEKIPGLVWRDGDHTYVNPSAPLIDMKDLHGNAWDLLPMNKYRAHNWQCLDGSSRQPYASIMTSLGCSFKCLSGDTTVNTIYGDIPIKELAEKYGDGGVPVYTYDPETRDVFITDSVRIRKYGEREQLVRVYFDDGTFIDCTPDHKFLQFKWGNGRVGSKGKQWECEAQDLKKGAHVRALRLEGGVKAGRVRVSLHWGNHGSAYRARLIMEYKLGRKLKDNEFVHHLDHIPSNDDPDNLLVLDSRKEHLQHHPEVAQRMRDNNPAKDGITPEWRQNISVGVTGLVRSTASRRNYRRAAHIRNQDPAYIEKLKVAATAREAKGYCWWTPVNGEPYRSYNGPRNSSDIRGRKGFDPHSQRRETNHRVMSVRRLPNRDDVYCLTVPATGWFFANNVLVKNCSFCCINAPFESNKYRMRDSTEVVNEIVMLHERYGVKTFKIVDEMFVLNERHYTEICKQLIATGLGPELNIWAYARVDTVKPHTLEMFHKAGFRWLALGIESGSKHVRDGALKALKTDDIVDVVRRIQRAGICVIGNYIFGLPDDDYSTMQATLNLSLELNTEFANFYACQAYPGSKLYEEAVKAGIELPKTWSGFSQHGEDTLPLSTQYLSAKQVLAFRDAAFQTYFTNPQYLCSIEHKFGSGAVEEIKKMTSFKLKRKLLEAA